MLYRRLFRTFFFFQHTAATMWISSYICRCVWIWYVYIYMYIYMAIAKYAHIYNNCYIAVFSEMLPEAFENFFRHPECLWIFRMRKVFFFFKKRVLVCVKGILYYLPHCIEARLYIKLHTIHIIAKYRYHRYIALQSIDIIVWLYISSYIHIIAYYPPAPMHPVKYSRAVTAEMFFQTWYTANTNHFRLTDFC